MPPLLQRRPCGLLYDDDGKAIGADSHSDDVAVSRRRIVGVEAVVENRSLQGEKEASPPARCRQQQRRMKCASNTPFFLVASLVIAGPAVVVSCGVSDCRPPTDDRSWRSGKTE